MKYNHQCRTSKRKHDTNDNILKYDMRLKYNKSYNITKTKLPNETKYAQKKIITKFIAYSQKLLLRGPILTTQ